MKANIVMNSCKKAKYIPESRVTNDSTQKEQPGFVSL